jgi:flagellar hook assembly protein FlgD
VGITVHVLNSAGEVVYTGPLMMYNHGLTGVTTTDGAFVPGSGVDAVFQLQGAGGTFTWDGLNSSGQVVQAGVYTLEFIQTNSPATGNFPTQVTVLSSQNQGSVSIFNSAGELVQYFPLISGSAAYLSFSENSIVPGTSGVKISWGTAGADSVTWNGLDSGGAQVASGVYKVVVTTQSPGSPEITLVGSIQVLDPSSDLLSGAVVAPNPLGAPGQSLTVYAPGLSASDSLAIGLYDLAGQLVAQSYGEGPKQSLTVPSSAAGGIYLVVLRAHSVETGANRRKVCKLAVIP